MFTYTSNSQKHRCVNKFGRLWSFRSKKVVFSFQRKSRQLNPRNLKYKELEMIIFKQIQASNGPGCFGAFQYFALAHPWSKVFFSVKIHKFKHKVVYLRECLKEK